MIAVNGRYRADGVEGTAQPGSDGEDPGGVAGDYAPMRKLVTIAMQD